MPNNNITLNTPEKQPPRASEGASKMKDGAHEIASAASNVAADKARQVRDQVDSTTSSTQGKASSLAHEAGAAVKQTADRVESAARGIASGAKEALNEVTHEASALLQDAQDVALGSYDAARDYAVDLVHDASELAQHASERTVRYVRRSSTATGKFASTHALPLVALGASLGWLTWSVRSKGRRSARELAPRTPSLRPPMEARRAPMQESRENGALRTTPTNSGAQLLGVRVPDARH